MAGPGPKHNGWWKDSPNNRLYFYQDGTAVGYIDSTSGLELLTGSMNVSGGLQIVGGVSVDGAANLSTTNINGAVTVSGAVTINDPMTYADTFYHASRHTLTITAGARLAVSSSGSLIEMSGPATASPETIQLPELTTAGVVGCQFTIVNTYPDGVSGSALVIDPSSEGIVGCGLSLVNSLDLVNTATTHKHGDYVTLYAGSTATWFLMDMAGTWIVT